MGASASIYRPQGLQADATCTLLQKAIPKAPPPHPLGLQELREKPQAKLPVAQKGAASRGGLCTESPREPSNKTRTCEAYGGVLPPSHYSLPSWRRLEPACHACYTCKISCFLVPKQNTPFPTHLPTKGVFIFYCFPTGCNYFGYLVKLKNNHFCLLHSNP